MCVHISHMHIYIHIYIYIFSFGGNCKNCTNDKAMVVSILYLYFWFAWYEGLFHCQRAHDESANKSSQQVGLRARLFLGINSNQLLWFKYKIVDLVNECVHVCMLGGVCISVTRAARMHAFGHSTGWARSATSEHCGLRRCAFHGSRHACVESAHSRSHSHSLIHNHSHSNSHGGYTHKRSLQSWQHTE